MSEEDSVRESNAYSAVTGNPLIEARIVPKVPVTPNSEKSNVNCADALDTFVVVHLENTRQYEEQAEGLESPVDDIIHL